MFHTAVVFVLEQRHLTNIGNMIMFDTNKPTLRHTSSPLSCKGIATLDLAVLHGFCCNVDFGNVAVETAFYG